MHRIVVNAPPGMEVDHIDGNRLNNTRANLRICSRGQNQQNRKRTQNSSRFKGVSWFMRHGLWSAYIKKCGKKIHLGYFVEEKEAALTYDAAARLLFGAYALFNLPGEDLTPGGAEKVKERINKKTGRV
jgi:hypothetical protein